MLDMSRMKVLSLYKSLLRESTKFSAFNYRHYAQRRIQDAFRENKSVTDPGTRAALISKAEENLEILKRQVTIGEMYQEPMLVIEQVPLSTA